MNLGEAISFVLRNRSQNLLEDFLREDLVKLLRHVTNDGVKLLKDAGQGFAKIDLKAVPRNVLTATIEVAQLVRVFPGRIRKGFSVFQGDMLNELDQLPDSREKTVFCLKVFGVLTSSSLATIYNLRSSGSTLAFGKLRLRSAVAQFLLAELILGSVRLFAVRFLSEVEANLTVVEDGEHLRYFRRILAGETDAIETGLSSDDPAFRVTEKLKKIILNGDDES